jgi:DNA-binding response OmpR family regulator
VLEELGHLPEAPLLIVTSRLADEHLWAEVLNLGGYDVLMKPFDRLEVLRVISLAWLHWKERRERAADAEMLAQVAAG